MNAFVGRNMNKFIRPLAETQKQTKQTRQTQKRSFIVFLDLWHDLEHCCEWSI